MLQMNLAQYLKIGIEAAENASTLLKHKLKKL